LIPQFTLHQQKLSYFSSRTWKKKDQDSQFKSYLTFSTLPSPWRDKINCLLHHESCACDAQQKWRVRFVYFQNGADRSRLICGCRIADIVEF
jgi:hypothetical protein